MTIVVGYSDGTDVFLAADSIGIYNNTKRLISPPKVFRRNVSVTNQPIVFGFCGSFRFGQLLQYKLNIPPLDNDDDVFGWAVCDLIPTIQNLCADSGLRPTKENSVHEICFLLGVNGRLLTIESDLQVGEVLTPYDAIGAGEEYALGSMFSTENMDLDVEDRLRLAIESSIAFCAATAAPINFVSTRDEIEFSVDEENPPKPEGCPIIAMV